MLSPCPSCHKTGGRLHVRVNPAQVECRGCGMMGPSGRSRTDAKRKWNDLQRNTDEDQQREQTTTEAGGEPC